MGDSDLYDDLGQPTGFNPNSGSNGGVGIPSAIPQNFMGASSTNESGNPIDQFGNPISTTFGSKAPAPVPQNYVKQGFIDIPDPYFMGEQSTNESGNPVDMFGNPVTGEAEIKRASVDQYGWYTNPYRNMMGVGSLNNVNIPGVYLPAGTIPTADTKGVPIPEKESSGFNTGIGFIDSIVNTGYKGVQEIGRAADTVMEKGMGEATRAVGPYIKPLSTAIMAYLTGGAALGAGAMAGGGAMGAAAGAGVGAVGGGLSGLASSGGDWGRAGIGAGIGAIIGGVAGGGAVPATPTYEGYGGDLAGLGPDFQYDPSFNYIGGSTIAPGVGFTGGFEAGFTGEGMTMAKIGADVTGAYGLGIGTATSDAAMMEGAVQGASGSYPGLGLEGVLDGAGIGMRETLGGASQADIDYGANLGSGIPQGLASTGASGKQPNILNPLSRVLINGVLLNSIAGSGTSGGIPGGGGIPMGPGTLADNIYKWTAQTGALTGLKGKSGYTRT